MTAYVPPYSPSLVDWQRQVSAAVNPLLRKVADYQDAVADFGALDDGSTDNYPAFLQAKASGRPFHFPFVGTGQYNFSSPLLIDGGMQVTADDGVVFHYTGSTSGAIVLSGQKNYVRLGEVNAPNAPYAITYHDLQFSEVFVRRPGSCTTACIYHDASAQTINAGNVRWHIGDIQAGSVPYGVKIDSHATHTLEGESWDINVILSATTCGVVLGTNGNDTVRFDKFEVGIDSQGITPLLIDIYNDSKQVDLKNWAGLVSPPVAHVRFNSGAVNNFVRAGPGVQGALIVQDNGTNGWSDGKVLRNIPVTVATLPTAGIYGRRAFVSDATATTFASTVAGGGSNKVPVWDNGTNWVIG